MFSSKDYRTIKRYLSSLFSISAYVIPKSIEDYKKIGFACPFIEINGNRLYLSEKSIEIVRSICDIFQKRNEKIEPFSTYNDIYQNIIISLEYFLNLDKEPNENEFIEKIEDNILKKVKKYTFISKLSGIQISEFTDFKFGDYKIVEFSKEIIEHLTSDNLSLNSITESFNKSCIIYGSELGTLDNAKSKFYIKCNMYTSMVFLYSCILFKNAFKNIKITIEKQQSDIKQRATTIYWHEEDNYLCHVHTMPITNQLKLSNEDYNTINELYFFGSLTNIIHNNRRNEIEDAIYKAIYWFGKTQYDETSESKWLSLWSCMESLFTIKNDQITEYNAIGIASILIYGGYNISFLGDYRSIKTRIKNYYTKRCKIVHNGITSIISNSDLDDFSIIVSWIIISVVALCNNGYDTKQKVIDQALRLDKIKSKI